MQISYVYKSFRRSLCNTWKNKDLSIVPRDKVFIYGDEYKSYKISVCQYCGQVYIEAVIDEEDYLIQKKRMNTMA